MSADVSLTLACESQLNLVRASLVQHKPQRSKFMTSTSGPIAGEWLSVIVYGMWTPVVLCQMCLSLFLTSKSRLALYLIWGYLGWFRNMTDEACWKYKYTILNINIVCYFSGRVEVKTEWNTKDDDVREQVFSYIVYVPWMCACVSPAPCSLFSHCTCLFFFFLKQNMFYCTYWFVCWGLDAPGPTAGEHSQPSMFTVVHNGGHMTQSTTEVWILPYGEKRGDEQPYGSTGQC